MRWGFKKKLARETWHTIGRIIKERDEAGLVSRVHAYGASLSDEKVRKEIARYKTCDANGGCCAKKELPIGIEVRPDQGEVEETILSLEAQGIILNNPKTANPSSDLHVSDESSSLSMECARFQLKSQRSVRQTADRSAVSHHLPGYVPKFFLLGYVTLRYIHSAKFVRSIW